MSKVQLAIEIAKRAHKGQVDKLGADYISHPLRAHRNLLRHPTFTTLDAAAQEDCEVAAIMHDVVEDSGVGPESEKFTVDDLLSQNFSPRSIELVQLLTRKPEDVESKDVYYENINANPLAKLVKWADIADNLNVHRTAGLPPEKKARLAERYAHALKVIRMDKEESTWMKAAIDFDLET